LERRDRDDAQDVGDAGAFWRMTIPDGGVGSRVGDEARGFVIAQG
jgi:hypothetical protein